MKKLLFRATCLFCFSTFIFLNAQISNTFFPLEYGANWNYKHELLPKTIESKIIDTTTINNQLYFCFTPYSGNQPYPWPTYWITNQSEKIFVLDTAQNIEYLLFDFTAEEGESWDIPPVLIEPYNQPINQCDWGTKITLSEISDTVQIDGKIFTPVMRFSHSGHVCYDSGILLTYFHRGIGIIKFETNGEGGVDTWEWDDGIPDTVTLRGTFTGVGNPCTTIPCLPGIAYVINCGDSNYILTVNNVWFSDIFTWNGYTPFYGDSIEVQGVLAWNEDLNGDEYCTIEIAALKKIVPSSVNSNPSANINFKIIGVYPNPFNSQAIVKFYSKGRGLVQVSIYNNIGQLVDELEPKQFDSGENEIIYSSNKLSSGVFYIELRQGKHRDAQKIILLK